MKILGRLLLLMSLFVIGSQAAMADKTAKILLDESQATAVFVFDEVTYSVGSTFTSYGVTYTVNRNLSSLKYNSIVETVVFDESYAEYRPTSLYEMFASCTKLSRFIHMENLNTSEVTNMKNHCCPLKIVDG